MMELFDQFYFYPIVFKNKEKNGGWLKKKRAKAKRKSGFTKGQNPEFEPFRESSITEKCFFCEVNTMGKRNESYWLRVANMT